VRFHANDNIADFIEGDELDLLQQEVAAKMQGCWKAWSSTR
jgi:GTP cyclohydrolase I